MQLQPILIDGRWCQADVAGTFRAENPATREPLADSYPVSSWRDCDAVLEATVAAADRLRSMSGAQIGRFLDRAAERIDARHDAIVPLAHLETALPISPRLADVELPRTTNQLLSLIHI